MNTRGCNVQVHSCEVTGSVPALASLFVSQSRWTQNDYTQRDDHGYLQSCNTKTVGGGKMKQTWIVTHAAAGWCSRKECLLHSSLSSLLSSFLWAGRTAGSQGRPWDLEGAAFRIVWTPTPEPPPSHLHPSAVFTGYRLRFRPSWHTSPQRNSPKFIIKHTHLVENPTDTLTVFQRCCWRPWNGYSSRPLFHLLCLRRE